MPVLNHTRVAIRFGGDDLDPDQLTLSLGVEPSSAHRKGDVNRSPDGSRIYAARKSGLWLLRASASDPGDLNGQIMELLDRLPADPETWKRLSVYSPDLSIGLFLKESNEGIGISADVLQAIAARGIELDFDIYGSIEKTPSKDQLGEE